MIEYLSEQQVLHLHRVMISATGGSAGVRDRGLLQSALARPAAAFGGQDLYESVPAKAAALMHSIVSNHAFVDGNKRVAVAAAELFLLANGFPAVGRYRCAGGVDHGGRLGPYRRRGDTNLDRAAHPTRLMVAAILVAAAGIGLAGCGDGASASDQTGVAPAVSFPLAQPIMLTVGVPESSLPATARPAWEVLQRRTNVTLRPIAIAGASAAARGTRLAELAAAGELPDLLAEGVAPIDFIRQREWLVNLLERPELTPNLHRLLQEHERFRQSTDGRLLAPGELYALGVFDAGASPYLGAIAYRQDLFEARGLGADTWEELLASLGALQSEFPGSTPFAATRRAVLFRAPSWFRSGVDERVAAYYHRERREWRLGPLEREFEDYLRWFHRLEAEGADGGRVARPANRSGRPGPPAPAGLRARVRGPLGGPDRSRAGRLARVRRADRGRRLGPRRGLGGTAAAACEPWPARLDRAACVESHLAGLGRDVGVPARRDRGGRSWICCWKRK